MGSLSPTRASSCTKESSTAQSCGRLSGRHLESSNWLLAKSKVPVLAKSPWPNRFGQGDFAKTGTFDFAKSQFDDSKWRPLNLPHDWAVELSFVHDDARVGDNDPMQSHGYKPLGRRYPETSVGWYRREFEVPAGDLGRRIAVEVDGAFRSVLVFVNGCFIGRNDNGYAPFHFDVSDFLNYGAKNHLVVRVDASFGDGWF